MGRTSFRSLRGNLIGLPRPVKSLIAVGTDYIGFLVCGAVAFWMVALEPPDPLAILPHLLLFALIGVGIVWAQGMYRLVVRFVGSDLLFSAVIVSTSLSVVGGLGALTLIESIQALRWSIAAGAFSLIFLCTSRYLASVFLLNRRARSSREKVIIYGAGAAAAQLVPSLLANDEFLPVALVDDDVTTHGSKVKGVSVHAPKQIARLIEELGATRVLLAMPSASRLRRRQVLERLSEHPVHVQTIPSFGDIVTGRAQVDEIEDVDVKDLLGRDIVPPNQRLLRGSISGKSVLVTGAGGSIGSELCRQILRLAPRQLVLLEISETALYSVTRELEELREELDNNSEIAPLLGSVHHEKKLREVLKAFDVNTVYHAAAYKHVPIVEQNVFEGIYNNIFGTLHCVRASIDAGVESFVLISTDKAVNPTNVMGATKRFAEMILQALETRSHRTVLSMVRFGNVLESSGSVVPLFKEQIRNGGPVTVTHRDIIRYFMTIPEAAQLVIQAGSMARGGDVFVLDMGKPVKILDLAHRMINLMGLSVRDAQNPEGDIEVKFVGLRPAEKLYEELLIGSNVTGTEHPRILRANEETLSNEVLNAFLDELRDACTALDFDLAREVLLDAVKEYEPSDDIDDLVWLRSAATAGGEKDDRIVDFPTPPKLT